MLVAAVVDVAVLSALVELSKLVSTVDEAVFVAGVVVDVVSGVEEADVGMFDVSGVVVADTSGVDEAVFVETDGVDVAVVVVAFEVLFELAFEVFEFMLFEIFQVLFVDVAAAATGELLVKAVGSPSAVVDVAAALGVVVGVIGLTVALVAG